MVGANPDDFKALLPIFEAYCENVVYAGPPGHGLVLKVRICERSSGRNLKGAEHDVPILVCLLDRGRGRGRKVGAGGAAPIDSTKHQRRLP